MSILHYRDDKKQKHQSHEVHSSHTECGADVYGYIDLTGYGATPTEALTNFITVATALQRELQSAIDQANHNLEHPQ